ncbi:DUF6370 family protein [Subsaxibacter sp. CAU 1640]|uniref:DUF6370 family protein n=1 Tax=Subsaxibacter sp. CAU 1640 TaxID=2933271 RepID=UPI002005C7C4|nr:DUF6370 family protein [Subsaxibacter sp. CAU 1640]MCK7589170.1 DUF6370 family protein [Subsaxibacter sp. CAU 1640]
MKKVIFIFAFILCVACKTEEKQVVEISCGQCQFGLTSQDGCDLAVRLDGKAYFVDGADIDDFGDAHDEQTGFCEVVRKAEVIGNVEDNRFKVSSVKLID